jgi:ABC-2 type transport system ATP-binding protein
LVGNNGCGKSTIIHIISNLTNYQSGEYFFENKKVTSQFVSFKEDLGIVLSEPYYIEEFDVQEYWRFVCKFQKVPKAEIAGRIADMLALLDLEAHCRKPIKALSSGNQMKVSIGAALIHNPKVLILDEPFVNLDIATTERLIALLKSLQGKKTLFVTSHSLELIAELCEQFLIMDEGRIIKKLAKSAYPTLDALKQEVKSLITHKEEKSKPDWLQ